MKNRTLVAWIGATDLASMGKELDDKTASDVEKVIRRQIRDSDDGGPLRSLLVEEEFDSIHLLNSYPKSLDAKWKKWLGKPVSIHHPKLAGPTDYSSIFTSVDELLQRLYANEKTRPSELCIHLSPGTPAMTAVWVLLGNSKYKAKFFQSYKGNNTQTEIPFDLDLHIKDVISDADRAYEHLRAHGAGELEGFKDIIGESKAMREAVGRAHRAAIRDVTVLLLGESGTGKTRFAEAIHKASGRHDGPFKTINCAAIPAQLLESELFGHVKGAFTGADKPKEGLFAEANHGTIFLDEIGECPLDLQAKLLTVLQPLNDEGLGMRKFRKVGGTREITVDVRVIAATNQSLIDQVEAKKFRLDLYYRLAAITIKLPPLRDRGGDITRLAEFFLQQINSSFANSDPEYLPKKFAPTGKSLIKSYHWPGNARQLYNSILQAVVMSGSNSIARSDLQASLEDAANDRRDNAFDQPITEDFSLPEYLESIQKHYLERGLEEANGVKLKASKLLGYKNWQTMDKQLKKLGIE